MTVANSIKSQLDEAEAVIRAQMARIAELEVEVERLTSACDAHGVLKAIYTDANQPTGHRLKAAGLALACETPRLTPQPPPLELTDEPVEDLATVVSRGRARMDRILALSLEERSEMFAPSRKGGNGDSGRD